MEELINILTNPYALTAILILSIASTFYMGRGIKRKNAADLIIGIAIGIPSYNVMSIKFWIVGLVTFAMGLWVRRKLEGGSI